VRRDAAAAGRPGASGGRALASCALAGFVAALGCAGPPPRHEPPEPALRIWTEGLVHWTGDRRTLPIAIENATGRTVQVEDPDPRRARVVLYSGSGPDRVCGRDADLAGPQAVAIALGPGESRTIPVDLGEACSRLPPGEYRYEVGYELPADGGGRMVRLSPSYGHVVVEAARPGTAERGGLGAGQPSGDAGPGGDRRGRR
jgi:hypothetical protein